MKMNACTPRSDETAYFDGSMYKFKNTCSLSNKEKKKLPVDCVSVKLCYSSDVVLEQPGEQFDFNNLINHLNEVKKPSKWWCYNVLENYLVILCWNQNCEIEKKIIVDSDLHVKVFLKDHGITTDLTVCSIEHLSSMMQIVADFKICQNLEFRSNSFMPYCVGYIEDNLEMCKMCRIVKKYTSMQKKAKSSILFNKYKRLSNRLKVTTWRLNCQKYKGISESFPKTKLFKESASRVINTNSSSMPSQMDDCALHESDASNSPVSSQIDDCLAFDESDVSNSSLNYSNSVPSQIDDCLNPKESDVDNPFGLSSVSQKNSKSSRRKCVYCGASKISYPDIRLFSFPNDPVMSEKWIATCNKPYLRKKTTEELHKSSYKICSLHFCDSDYATIKRHNLHASAEPKLLDLQKIQKAVKRKMDQGDLKAILNTN